MNVKIVEKSSANLKLYGICININLVLSWLIILFMYKEQISFY